MRKKSSALRIPLGRKRRDRSKRTGEPMKVLLAEDNVDLARWIAKSLAQDRFVVDCVHRGDDADAALASHLYAIAIVDLALPHLDGVEVIRRLRRRGDATPVIILTANDAVSSRIRGLDSGADDYLVKPFDVKELAARIRAQLRRSRVKFDSVIALGALSFDANDRTFSIANSTFHVTAREHALLETLLARAGRPVSKDALAESIFGFNEEANDNAIEIIIHRLRKKLEGSGVAIGTMRGLGYLLRVDDGK
jgi:two-component system, OmpR family, response regulator TctD